MKPVTYRIEIFLRALRDLKSLKASAREAVKKRIESLKANPRPPGVES
jgi:mRNA-degrading endonuclease RelE of RelBE toxin-antitoxin system